MTDPAVKRFSVGDRLVFCDDYFVRRRMPLLPMVSFPENGKTVYQLLQTTWLQKVPKEGDAESASTQ